MSGLLEKYDLFLLDLWGVVHDGTYLYDGVLDTLQMLRANNKQVIFISNAPRRAHKAANVLEQLGVCADVYHTIVTSGEVGFQWLKDGKAPWGKKYYFVGPAKDADVLDGLDFVRVDDVKAADFLLNVGFGSEEQTSDDFSVLLRSAKALSLPMLCLNPDLEVVKITGEHFPCAGVLAKFYEQIGGEVTWFGKPYAEIYDTCEAEAHGTKARTLAVGDSLHTDIAGGERYGIDTMLITGGILKHESEARIAEMCVEQGVRPTYIQPSLAAAFLSSCEP